MTLIDFQKIKAENEKKLKADEKVDKETVKLWNFSNDLDSLLASNQDLPFGELLAVMAKRLGYYIDFSSEPNLMRSLCKLLIDKKPLEDRFQDHPIEK